MERPTDYEKCLSILILRTLSLSQDAVANIIHCGKPTVVDVEKWIKGCALDEAINLCDDQAMKRLVGREFPELEELDNKILVKAAQLVGEDVLRHYRKDFIAKPPVQGPFIKEAKRKHISELRSVLVEWMNQLPPPSKLPYAVKVWLVDEMPREMLYEIFEQPDTTNLFDNALENQEGTQFSGQDYHLPVESNPAFAYLLIHLSDHPIVGNLEKLKQQSMKLAFDYGILTGAISQTVSDTSFQQCYKQQLSTLGGYTEVVEAVSASKTATHIIGSMLLCDLFAYALIEARSKTFPVNFAESMRELRAVMAIALAYMVRDSGQISTDLTNLARILWDDRDDSIGVQARVHDLLNRVEQLQQFYDELQEPFRLLLNEDPFPGKCPSCPDYTENNVTEV